MKKRILAALLALVTGVSALSGCNSSNEKLDDLTSKIDEQAALIAELTSEIAEVRNALVLPAGSLDGDFQSISDSDAAKLDELFAAHELNLLASPPSGTQVKARDWSKYSTDASKSDFSDAEAELYNRIYDVCEEYINNPVYGVAADNYYYLDTKIGYSDLGLTKDEAVNVLYWFKYNNPQFYFISTGCRYSSSYLYPFIFNFVMELPDQGAATNALFDKLDGWIAQCSKESSDWDKVTAANKLICENIIYSPDVKAGVQGSSGGKNQSMYSVLMSDDTVCSGYAQTFTAMANAMGIDAYTVCSSTHAWNAARFEDGNYYFVDVCWNDEDNEKVYKEEWVGVGTDFANSKTSHELDARSRSFGPNIQSDNYDGDDKTGGFAAPSIRVSGSGGRVIKVEWDAISGAEKYAYQVTSGVSSYLDTSTKDNYLVAVIPEGVASVDVKVRAVGTVNGKTEYSKWAETSASLGSASGSKPANVKAERTETSFRVLWDKDSKADGWLFIAHGEDDTLSKVWMKYSLTNNSVGWASWLPEKDTYFSIMSIKRSGNTETYSEPVQFKYNINDGMKLVENTVSSGGSRTSNSNSSSGTSGSNIVTKVYSTGTYVGEMVNGVINGQGKMTWTSGAVYEGEWKDAAYNGYGKYTGADGSTYEGYFVNGKRTGQGKSVSADGKSTYEGEFKDSSLISGKITVIYGNSTGIYESSNFINGKMNGPSKETIKYNSGDVRVISGNAGSDGAISGEVVYDYSWAESGHRYHHEGTYTNGKFNGQGVRTYYYPSGEKFIAAGEFKDGDIYNGTRDWYRADGSVYLTETFVNGTKT